MRQYLLIALLCLSGSPAVAQYQWTDQSGQMVFSDRPPPASVPLARILRVGDPIATPKRPANETELASADNKPTGRSEGRSEGRPESRAEKLAAKIEGFNERREQRAEAKSKAKEAKLASAAKTQRCKRLKSRMASINSGIRLTRRDANGERVYLSNKQRSTLGVNTRKHLSACG